MRLPCLSSQQLFQIEDGHHLSIPHYRGADYSLDMSQVRAQAFDNDISLAGYAIDGYCSLPRFLFND